MKKLLIIITVVVAVIALGVSSAVVGAKKDSDSPRPGIDFNGPHYNLNLIAKNKVMPGDYDNPDRHTMFVPLDTTDMYIDLETPNNLDEETLDGIKIEMTQGPEFAMIDGNATDGYGAFELGPGKYWVYMAVKAKSPKYPDAYTDITGWVEAFDNTGSLWYYVPVGSVHITKNGKWTDATDLFFVTAAEDPFGFYEWTGLDKVDKLGIWVFDYMGGLDTWFEDTSGDSIYNFSDLAYFWQFDNHGNKLIQVRFYPMD